MNVHRFKNGNQARRCISCKAHVSDQDRVCPVCGESLNTTSQPARPAAKPASGPLPPPDQEHSLARNTEVTLFTPTSVAAQPAPQPSAQQSANVAVVTAMAQSEPPAKPAIVSARPRTASAPPRATNGAAKAKGTAKSLPAAKPPPAQARPPKPPAPSINIVVVFGAVALLMVGALLLRLGASARSGEGTLAASEAQAMNVTVVFAQTALTATQDAQVMPLPALGEPTATIATPIAVRIISPTSGLVAASAEITNARVLATETAVATATDRPTATAAATATALPTQTPEPTNTPKPTATEAPATSTSVPTSAPRLAVVNSPQPTDTPQPTVTDVPPTATAVPTWTPRPTSTATTAPTPEPTDTPQPTATDVPPTATTVPTWTPRPTSTATTAPTPEPTDTPQPTVTDVPPTATLQPTWTPRATSTATAAPTPEPTATDAPPTATTRPTWTPEPTATDGPPTATSSPTTPTATQVPTFTPLPAAQDGVLRYAVKQGDTCLDIANQFGVSLARLIAYNQFDARTCFLSIGQIVFIPTADSIAVERATAMALPTAGPMAAATQIPPNTPAAVPTQRPTATPAAPQAVYTVQGGDTCGGIARRFGILVAQLAAANGLNRTVCFLRVGQPLVISSTSKSAPVAPGAVALPSPTPGSKVYVVKPGDTCLEIATRYKVTVNRLAAANNLNPRTCFLSVGRKLVIP